MSTFIPYSNSSVEFAYIVPRCFDGACLAPYTVYQVAVTSVGSEFTGTTSAYVRSKSVTSVNARCRRVELFDATSTSLSVTSTLPLPLEAEPTEYIINVTDVLNGTWFTRVYPILVCFIA